MSEREKLKVIKFTGIGGDVCVCERERERELNDTTKSS